MITVMEQCLETISPRWTIKGTKFCLCRTEEDTQWATFTTCVVTGPIQDQFSDLSL